MNRPYQPPVQPTPKKHSHRRLWIVLGIIVVALLLLCTLCSIIGSHLPKQITSAPTATPTTASVQVATQAPTPTDTPILAPTPTDTPTLSATPSPTATPKPTPTAAPTQSLAPIPSASELTQLLSSVDGKVTDVNTPSVNSDGTKNVAVEVTVNNPTQARVKHINYELMQFFFLRSDVGAVNITFHAKGYTGMDDPIADCVGLAPSNWIGMDENQLWTALAGVFDANLPA